MMRKAKKLILTCLMLILVLTASAQTNQRYDWSKIMNAIIQVESRGNAKAHNANGDCIGILQITPILVKQCNIWLKNQKSSKRYTLKDRYDVGIVRLKRKIIIVKLLNITMGAIKPPFFVLLTFHIWQIYFLSIYLHYGSETIGII